jgi:hypothetical protein
MFRRASTILVVLLAALPAFAGDIDLQWNPSAGADGYKLYRGLTTGGYSDPTDVGNVTSTLVGDLSDCTTHYFAVTAYNAAGDSTYSNEIFSFPDPRVGGLSPASAEQDRALDLVLTGMNFQDGATVEFSDPGITIRSLVVNSCSEMIVGVTVGGGANPGPVNVTVRLASNAWGTSVGAFTVEPAVAPDVSSTNPSDGATGVSIAVSPTATFSEPIDVASVTASTARLLDSNNQAIAQAPGSPSLSGDGTVVTINPQDDLVEGRTYRVEIVGGASGVLDLAGHSMSATYRQSTGFATVSDTTAPGISGIADTNVGSTSATVVWTTDEPADGRVLYRAAGASEYQASNLDANMVLDHSIALEGLAPDTTYQYHVESTDEAGNTAESSPDRSFTTSSSAFAYMRFESEAGDRTGAMTVRSVASAFLGEAIETTAVGSRSNPSGTTTFGVNVPTAGTWFLWVRMYASSPSAGSMTESIDGASRVTLEPATTGSWVWVAGRQYDLGTGLHEVELGGVESGAQADRVLLTDDAGFVPTESPTGDNAATGPVTQFAATGIAEAIDLSWTTPGDADFARTVIRFRTDGQFPVSPEDGFLVIDRAGSSGSTENHVHSGLQVGTTYSYAAFAIDDNGNVSDASTAEATPIPALQPPAAPTGLQVSPP